MHGIGGRTPSGLRAYESLYFPILQLVSTESATLRTRPARRRAVNVASLPFYGSKVFHKIFANDIVLFSTIGHDCKFLRRPPLTETAIRPERRRKRRRLRSLASPFICLIHGVAKRSCSIVGIVHDYCNCLLESVPDVLKNHLHVFDGRKVKGHVCNGVSKFNFSETDRFKAK